MNSGRANNAAIRLIGWSLAILVGLFAAAWLGMIVGGFIWSHPGQFVALWAVFLVAVLYLTRDPDPIEPSDLKAIVAPAHGKVDVIEEAGENEFMKGACKRISIRVSLMDVQVQYAPVTGAIQQFVHQPAMKEGGPSAVENLFIGFDVVGRPNVRVAMRLIGGTWGKRIVPWIKGDEVVGRSVRIGMMRPASRVDLYLPTDVKLHVNLGDEVGGGQTVVAKFE
jgi:phosphatidylserine decarboxylase